LKGEIKNGLLIASPLIFLKLFTGNAGFGHPGNQLESKITKALDPATAPALSPIFKTP
jgi:hypothetical protein